MATNAFIFPRLRLKKSSLGNFNYDRICFQFVVDKNKVCTLIGFKMKQDRTFKSSTSVVVAEKDPETAQDGLVISSKILFVQLELSKEQLESFIGADLYLRFRPTRKRVQGFTYVIYDVNGGSAASGGDSYTHPCPPAIPPGGEG
jgi:hypothetical protein